MIPTQKTELLTADALVRFTDTAVADDLFIIVLVKREQALLHERALMNFCVDTIRQSSGDHQGYAHPAIDDIDDINALCQMRVKDFVGNNISLVPNTHMPTKSSNNTPMERFAFTSFADEPFNMFAAAMPEGTRFDEGSLDAVCVRKHAAITSLVSPSTGSESLTSQGELPLEFRKEPRKAANIGHGSVRVSKKVTMVKRTGTEAVKQQKRDA